MSSEIIIQHEEKLSGQPDLNFALSSNGFSKFDGKIFFDPNYFDILKSRFASQKVSFFGPVAYKPAFFDPGDSDSELFESILGQDSVLETIAKYRVIDHDQAKIIAFMLGGIIRDSSSKHYSPEQIRAGVDFASRMIRLGENISGEAIASAVSMYLISGGEIDTDKSFSGWIYHMAEAIKDNPISPTDTKDLGNSQGARLRGFKNRLESEDPSQFPDISYSLEAFEGFP